MLVILSIMNIMQMIPMNSARKIQFLLNADMKIQNYDLAALSQECMHKWNTFPSDKLLVCTAAVRWSAGQQGKWLILHQGHNS